MTLLQKIQNLTWFNEVNKLKSILLDLFNSSWNLGVIEAGTNITFSGDGTQASPLVINSSGGGSQDLQSVLDEGYFANSPNAYSEVTYKLTDVAPFIQNYVSTDELASALTLSANNTQAVAIIDANDTEFGGSVGVETILQKAYLDMYSTIGMTQVHNKIEVTPSENNTTYRPPTDDAEGVYTLATKEWVLAQLALL